MLKKSVLILAAALAASSFSAANAKDYQDGKTAICKAKNSCSVTFRNPGARVKLVMTNLSCKALTTEDAVAFVTEFFDGVTTLYVPTVQQDRQLRSFVASTAGVRFITGGPKMKVTFLQGAVMDSQISCTLTGVTS